jgi:hypothetical protein
MRHLQSLADFRVGLADKIVGGCKPADVGHSLKVPHDQAWFHSRSPNPRKSADSSLTGCKITSTPAD